MSESISNHDRALDFKENVKVCEAISPTLLQKTNKHSLVDYAPLIDRVEEGVYKVFSREIKKYGKSDNQPVQLNDKFVHLDKKPAFKRVLKHLRNHLERPAGDLSAKKIDCEVKTLVKTLVWLESQQGPKKRSQKDIYGLWAAALVRLGRLYIAKSDLAAKRKRLGRLHIAKSDLAAKRKRLGRLHIAKSDLPAKRKSVKFSS